MPRHGRILGLMLIAPLIVSGCATPSGGVPASPPVAVKTAPVSTTTIAGTVVYSGNAEAGTKINLLPKTTGQITTLNVQVGSAVKTGDVIAELDHAAQDAQVDQAQAGVAAAQAKLATIQAGPRPETVAQAQANLQAAQQSLSTIKSGGRADDIAAAQGQLTAAEGKLTSLQQGRSEAVAQAQANLDAAKAKLQQLKDGPTQQQIKAGQLAVEQAKDAANAANVAKDAACNPAYPAAQCNAARASAFSADTAVQQAQQQLNILTSPPTQDQLNQAQAAVDAAQAQLQLAQHPASAGDITAAQGAVQSAQAQLDLAKLPYSSADLAKAQAAVDVAQQQLKLAQTPYTQQDLDAAKAAVQQARAALEVATVARDQAIVKSPIDGTVVEKGLDVGVLATPSTPIAVIIDNSIDVVVNADAAQASALKAGDPATITSDALPGTSIPGTIATIYPTVDPQARTVKVKIVPTASDSGLKDGMLAQVALVTASHRGVIAVPSSAVVQRDGQSVVFVVANNTATPVPVQTGLSNGTETEVTRGLQVGQVVVVSGQDRLVGVQPVVVQK